MVQSAQTAGGEPKKGGGGRTLLIVAAALVILVGGAFAFVQLGLGSSDEGTGAAQGGAPSSPEKWVQKNYQIPLLYVNLAGTQGKRYLKVGCTIEFSAEHPDAELQRFQEIDTTIRDGLITLLSGKTLEDIDGSEKKRALKGEIRKTLSATLYPEGKDGRVDEVFYYEFLVQ